MQADKGVFPKIFIDHFLQGWLWVASKRWFQVSGINDVDTCSKIFAGIVMVKDSESMASLRQTERTGVIHCYIAGLLVRETTAFYCNGLTSQIIVCQAGVLTVWSKEELCEMDIISVAKASCLFKIQPFWFLISTSLMHICYSLVFYWIHSKYL